MSEIFTATFKYNGQSMPKSISFKEDSVPKAITKMLHLAGVTSVKEFDEAELLMLVKQDGKTGYASVFTKLRGEKPRAKLVETVKSEYKLYKVGVL